MAATKATRLGCRLLEFTLTRKRKMFKNSVCCTLAILFIFGGIAWRIHGRRASRENRSSRSVQIFKFIDGSGLECPACRRGNK